MPFQIPGLVKIEKTIWKDPPFSMGKSTINVPFSIAMLNYQRVYTLMNTQMIGMTIMGWITLSHDKPCLEEILLKMAIEIVDLPIRDGDFPVRKL